MVWYIIAFFVIMIWKYCSYSEKEYMRGYKSFYFALFAISIPFLVKIAYISVREPISDCLREGNIVGLICFLFGCFVAVFPGLCVFLKAFEKSKDDDDDDNDD